MKAPVLGLYGGADESITAAQIEAMRAAIKTADKSSEIRRVPEHAAWVQRRLSSELSAQGGPGRMDADAGVV